MHVNSADVILTGRAETLVGLEAILIVDHLASFLLTNLMLDLLEKSASNRVITVCFSGEPYDISAQKRLWGRARGSPASVTCRRIGGFSREVSRFYMRNAV